MSGRRRIVLHIGLPKTGTSTIQNVLYTNREFLLAEEGVLYPFSVPNPNIPLGSIFRHDPEKQMVDKLAGLTSEEMATRRKRYLRSLDAEISSHEWNTLLLSAELISTLTVPEIVKLREWGERYSPKWTVLVCVRHPVDWTRSVIQQLLKSGDTLQQLYEAICCSREDQFPMPNYRDRISRAISVFGRENVRVYDFDAAVESDGGIVGAFARQVGLSASSGDFLASRAVRYNESLSLEGARILDSLNRQRPLFADGVRAPRRSGPRHELAYIGRIKGQSFDVPGSVKEDIRLRSREDVAWLNETFGLELYRDVTDFAPHVQSHEEPVEALSDPAVESIAEIVGELVAESAFHRLLDSGKVALGRGDLERAARMLREAARLDPDAPQPKKLLKEVTAKQPGRFTGAPARRLKP